MTIIHDITGTAGFKVSLIHNDAIAVRNCMRCGTFEVIHAWTKKKHCPFLPSTHPFFSPSPSPSSPPLFSASNPRWIGCCRVYFTWGLLLVQSLFLWLLLTYIQQYTLKGLLMYKGWMFDPRGSVESYSHLALPGKRSLQTVHMFGTE